MAKHKGKKHRKCKKLSKCQMLLLGSRKKKKKLNCGPKHLFAALMCSYNSAVKANTYH